VTTLKRSSQFQRNNAVAKLVHIVGQVYKGQGTLKGATRAVRTAALRVEPGVIEMLWDTDMLTLEDAKLLMFWRVDEGLKP
jgi:hypothetical protein